MKKRLFYGFGVAAAIIGISILLSLIITRDSDLYEGEPVYITVGTNETIGHIYTIRGDRRYTIRYMTQKGEFKLGTFKRFEFRKLNPESPDEATLIEKSIIGKRIKDDAP